MIDDKELHQYLVAWNAAYRVYKPGTLEHRKYKAIVKQLEAKAAQPCECTTKAEASTRDTNHPSSRPSSSKEQRDIDEGTVSSLHRG